MCSLNDCNYNDNDELRERTKDLLTDTALCRKCKYKDIDVLLVGQSGYCKTCFLTATNHKFRAAIGKSKIIRYGESILVDHSDKLNSIVLLHLIKASINESAHKRLIFKTLVLYIDDSTVQNDSTVQKKINKERYILRSKIIEQIKNSGFIGYAVSLGEVLKKEDDIDIKLMDDLEVDNENDDQLRTILAKLPDDTSRIDLLDQLRRKLLIIAARKLNCNKIFQADSATDIASKVLANICLGRSTQLSTLANFCDTRCADIKILKPMRDFTQQELLYYSEYHKLDFLKLKESNVLAPTMSIQELAHNFTMGLESKFSGTVSAIFRTAEKLSTRDEEQDMENNCVLCNAKLDLMSHNDEVSAMRAIEVSKFVSSECVITKDFSSNKDNKNSQLNNKRCCEDSADCAKNNKRQTNAEDIWKCLCYSCKLIFRDSDIYYTFPVPLLFTIEQRLALRNMRKEINDFLL